MANEIETPETPETPEAPDLSWIPDDFKTESGFDTAKFRESYDSLAAYKGQQDDFAAQLPESADGYAIALPEGHEWPEGFDPASLSSTDEQGNTVEFDASKLIDKDDPDVKAMQSILFDAKAHPDLAGRIASLFVNRELRAMQQAETTAAEEKKALGPQADARLSTIKRELAGRMEKPLADALANSIVSADVLRGLEKLIMKSKTPVPSANSGKDLEGMSNRELIAAGLEQRGKRA